MNFISCWVGKGPLAGIFVQGVVIYGALHHMREIQKLAPEIRTEMSKRLLCSAIIATIMMAAATAYTQLQHQPNETATAYEVADI